MNYHLDVKTTTFVNRHRDEFLTAADLLGAPKKEPLSILQIGPGMALKGMGRYNHLGKFQLIKRLETALRRLPLPIWCYENFETQEVLDIFKDHDPKMTVGDISQKSLNMIQNTYGANVQKTVQLDLGIDMTEGGPNHIGQFDVVICLTTVSRVSSQLRDQARINLAYCTRPGGLAITEQNLAPNGLVKEPGQTRIYRKPAV